MKTVGIIVEYNPLHNGHLHHIQKTRELSGCDCLIAVMSSHFTQRGTPTIVDKFTRTKWALENGVDLVVELPFVLGVQSANYFAYHSVDILSHLGVEEIYFGSESGDIRTLKKLGEILDSKSYNDRLLYFSKQGYSYPTASDMAIKEITKDDNFNLPNNILGIQYIRSGQKINPNITFFTIPRIDSGYYDEVQKGKDIQSATSIRKLAFSNQDYKAYVPQNVYTGLKSASLVQYNQFLIPLKTILSRSTTTELRQIFHVDEGLEYRIKKINHYDSISEFLDKIISKRYTYSKLQRMIAFILVNVHKMDIENAQVSYIRILGMNQSGRLHLANIKKELQIPLYTKIKEGLHPFLDIEIRVTKLYSIAANTDLLSQEFQPVIF
jgi:predicted nucleotidyltransferase